MSGVDAGSEPLYEAWCVIANAADWRMDGAQHEQWREAAERWRDQWHEASFDVAPDGLPHEPEFDIDNDDGSF